MTTDLHHKITEAIKTAEFATRRMGPPPSPLGSLNVSDFADALRAVVELCVDRQAEAVDGGMTDVDTVWPSEVLTVIAEQLGIREASSVRSRRRSGSPMWRLEQVEALRPEPPPCGGTTDMVLGRRLVCENSPGHQGPHRQGMTTWTEAASALDAALEPDSYEPFIAADGWREEPPAARPWWKRWHR